jgi:hypothetical protein
VNDKIDLVAINTNVLVRICKSKRSSEFMEVGRPFQALIAGDMKILDYNDDGRMDVIVEVALGVDQMVKVLDIFGTQSIPPSGKRQTPFALFDHLGTTKLLVNNKGIVTWPRLMGTKPNETLPFGKDLDFDPDHPRQEHPYAST